MTPISPKETRYIKLGEQNRWAAYAVDQGELHFGYQSVPHDMCLHGDWDAVTRFLAQSGGQGMREARNAAREIRDFYTLGADCLWITIFDKHLWWTFAAPEVTWLGPEAADRGVRMRKAIGGWRKADVTGQPLRSDQLSTRLTQLSAYRMTICSVRTADYLLRRINGIEEPVIAKADAAAVADGSRRRGDDHRASLGRVRDHGRSHLRPWRLAAGIDPGRHGGRCRPRAPHPPTAETAFVQVKSRADQSVLDDYVARYRPAARI